MKKFSDGKWLLSFMLALLMMLVMLPVTCIQVHAQTTGSDDKYLTFTGTADFKLTISFCEGATLQYATADPDKDESWNPVTSGTKIDVQNPYVLYLRGYDNSGKQLFDYYNHLSIESTGTVACSGNIMTLLDYNAPDQAQMGDFCFDHMFYNCKALTAAPALPATELKESCYENMFSDCSSLTAAPALPATELKESCYENMFSGCSSLTAAPALPATELADYCYSFMFSGCSSLTAAPALPATELAKSCYECMFDGCSSLTAAPNLPAEELAESCYENMFYGCRSLTTAPELPAITLAASCYRNMFRYCTGIMLSENKTYEYDVPYRIPSSGEGTSASNALDLMFDETGGAFQGTPEINKTYYMKVDYLTFTAEEDNSSVTINLKEGCSLEYSQNGGGWTDYTNNTSITLNKDEYVRFRGRNNKNKQLFDLNNHVTLTGKVACSGNIMTLLDYNHPDQAQMGDYCFKYMFSGCTGLTTAPSLPATTLADDCYRGMFSGCTNLTTAPELPATELAANCYYGMFTNCTSLTAASELPATKLASYCYFTMFSGCTGLTAAPELKATKLANYCYGWMFFGCTGLTAAPELKATKLASGCYNSMFNGCKDLTAAPKLSATTLADSCCKSMFSGCTSLTAAPALPAEKLALECYAEMFSGCTGLTAAPELPATTLANYCYAEMFSGCSGLTAAPALRATELANGCYYNMFSGCSSLTAAPALPATDLAETCYMNMFEGCSSLTTAPALRATELANECYYNMFSGCTGIRLSENQTYEYDVPYSIPSYGTETPNLALDDMFSGTGGDFRGTPVLGKIYYMKVDYLTFTAEEDNSSVIINLKEGSLKYSKKENDGEWTGWTDYANGAPITLDKNDNVRFRGSDNENKQLFDSGKHVTISGIVACSGNIMTLLDYNAPDQAQMGDRCFSYMFYGCSGLTAAPALPATKLAEYCYSYMFDGCSSLTAAPALPATKLADSCYYNMFSGCSSLTVAPALPATELAEGCYDSMFKGCSSLTAAPALPAPELADGCYYNMFSGCTGIKLSTEKTGDYAVAYKIPASGTGTPADCSLDNMFFGTGGAFQGTPEINKTYYMKVDYLTFTPVAEEGDSTVEYTVTINLKEGCSLEYSKNGGGWTDYTNNTSITLNKDEYVRFRGYNNENKQLFDEDNHVTISGKVACSGNIMTLLNYNHPDQAKMGDNCFRQMFYGCTGLTAAPALPATELSEYCYYGMFSGCSSLTAAPALPATKMAYSCYSIMFSSCTGLTAAPKLSATTLASYCYCWMFSGCSSLTAAPALPATKLADYCYYWMFSGCTGIKLSETKTDYTEEYRIPSSDTGTPATRALSGMFSGTGGDFIGTPDINTTYYMDIGLAKAPVITTQPADLTLKYGASSGNILGVQAKVATGHAVSYQWYSNTTNSNEGGTAIQNATDSSYTIPSDTAIGTTYFYCIITAKRNDNGNTAAAVSNTAAVSVGKAVATDYSVPILTGTSLSFYGSALHLIKTEGSTAQGKMYYAVTESDAEPDVWTDNVSAITAEKAGKFYVWYKIDGENYELTPTKLGEVTVTIVPVNEITLNEDNLELTVGSTVTLTATVTPDNATYPAVTWTSDKESVATVENSVVSAVSAGTATITATAGGKSATCTVTVKAKNNSGYIPITPSYPSDDQNNTNNDGPKIVGNGISGWDNIAAEIKKTPEGGKVTIDMAGATTIPSSVLNAVKGKNVDIILDMDDGIKWTINGKSITYILWNIDMGVTVGKSGIPVKVINNITGEKYNVVISLAHNGPFGFKATLTINMRRQDAGLIANLFYYNRTTKKLEYVCGGKIMDDGSVSLEFNHASDYTIIVDDHILGKELTAKVGRTGNVKLSWTAQDSAESYEVYQVIDGKWVKLGTTTKTTYTVKGLKNNKTCKFMVRYNVGGNLSAKSDSLKLKLKVYYKPALKATKSDGKLTLTWKEVPGATKYRIYAVKNDKLVKLKNTKLLTYSTSSKVGKTYRFAVKAYVNGKWTRIETSDIIKVKVK